MMTTLPPRVAEAFPARCSPSDGAGLAGIARKYHEADLCALLLLQTFPALFGLYNNGFLPKGIRIVGYARTKMDEEVRHSTRVQPSISPRRSQLGCKASSEGGWGGRAHLALYLPPDRSVFTGLAALVEEYELVCSGVLLCTSPRSCCACSAREGSTRAGPLMTAQLTEVRLLSCCRSSTSAFSSTSRLLSPP